MKEFKLFDAEYKFLEIIWSLEPVKSMELSKVCLEKLGWKKSTTYTMIRKLCNKKVLKTENTIIVTLINKEQVQKYESEALLSKSFNGSLPAFIASFLQDKKLTEKEALEIKKMIEEQFK